MRQESSFSKLEFPRGALKVGSTAFERKNKDMCEGSGLMSKQVTCQHTCSWKTKFHDFSMYLY